MRSRQTRPRREHAPLLVVLAAIAALLAPTAATAFYGNGAQIVSADFNLLEQGDDTTTYAAISADGRYVAIQTRARNFFADDDPDPSGQYRAGGIFRFDLATKTLEKVADGDLFDEATNQFLRRGASNPSISADGRFVAFVTAEPLLAVDENDNVDVYVRDMSVSAEGPGAYDLVSARDGGDLPASYGVPAFPLPGSEPGAELSRGVAISGNGRKVVFRTDASSDLPAAAAPEVPPGQVYLRDRVANTTTLVTALRDPEAGSMTALPAGGAVGAALSADGTTVAWTGANAAAQTRFLEGENADSSFLYYLWRRVASGPDAPTRRITGLADPDDPACPPGPHVFDRESTGPCYGPLANQEATLANIGTQLPALSGDGETVAFLTGAGPRPLGSTNPGLDLFLTRMTPGLTRKGATVELTRDTLDNDSATASQLGSIAMSAGGKHLALTTARTRFTLPALQLLGEPRAVPNVRELYVVDLQERTLERVARAWWGGDIDSDVQNGVTLSADGARVAFSSFAGNLFFGDANQRPDAFVAERQSNPAGGPSEGGSSAASGATIEVDDGGPRIAVRAKSKPGGLILITVSVPAAGGVKAVARARAGSPRKIRTLGTGATRARGAARSTVRMRLHPVRRYRAELRRRGTIDGRIVVSYVASRGGRHAAASVRVVFRQSLAPNKAGRRRQK
jgi:hypothetical protein